MAETVFVLGAGFSAPAKVPVQNDIMKNISAPLKNKRFYKNVTSLYKTLFGVEEQNLYRIPLEDVFSFLDRSISSREDINNLELGDIWKKEGSLRRLVTMVLNEKLNDFSVNSKYKKVRQIYRNFFKALVDKRMEDQKGDPFSIVSLNWDTIPEFFINKISKYKGYEDVNVDYTVYDHSHDYVKRLPSIHLKTKGYYNIKIAKIHGSVNWGYCSNCGRLYVKHSSTTPPVFYEKNDSTCKECSRTKLKRLIITPTFMKDLNNTHLRMTWHNALMDLQQARRIIFVGYSLPLADFEFRYILTKAIAGSNMPMKNKKIRAILYPPDNLINLKTNIGKRSKWERDSLEKRYSDFFSHLSYDYRCMDALDFMQDSDLIWEW